MKRPALRWPAISPPRPGAAPAPLWRRLGWMALLWLASTSALLLVALVLRWVLKD